MSSQFRGPDATWRGRMWAWGKVGLVFRRAFGGRREDRLAETLDGLKGLPMKLGQHLSYHASTIHPETVKDLERLQEGRAAVPSEDVRRVVEGCLGMRLEVAFERFDPTPLGAASVAQVHRATVDGRDVAVKVLYPGCRESLALDVGGMKRLARLSPRSDDAMLEALGQTLVGEADLLAEGTAQRRFRERFAADPDLAVPDTLPERSMRDVLTMELVELPSLRAFAATAPERARRRAALALLRFAYRSLLVHHEFQADPHPGNFLVEPDGRVHPIDFGCVHRFPPKAAEALAALLRAQAREDLEGQIAALDALGFVTDRATYDWAHSAETFRGLHRPLHGPTRVTREDLAAAAERSGRSSPNDGKVWFPLPLLFGQRLEWGVHALLALLDVEVDGREVRDAVLAEAGA
jgi:predicted unusual protein kinase regulating ubiquinone biosynthesis (AarF/ABC1/UbiB family)